MIPLSHVLARGMLDGLLGVCACHAVHLVAQECCAASVGTALVVLSAWIHRLQL